MLVGRQRVRLATGRYSSMVEGTAYLGVRQRNEVKSEAARAKEEAKAWRTVGV